MCLRRCHTSNLTQSVWPWCKITGKQQNHRLHLSQRGAAFETLPDLWLANVSVTGQHGVQWIGVKLYSNIIRKMTVFDQQNSGEIALTFLVSVWTFYYKLRVLCCFKSIITLQSKGLAVHLACLDNAQSSSTDIIPAWIYGLIFADSLMVSDTEATKKGVGTLHSFLSFTKISDHGEILSMWLQWSLYTHGEKDRDQRRKKKVFSVWVCKDIVVMIYW